jgi:hypothetical protein
MDYSLGMMKVKDHKPEDIIIFSGAFVNSIVTAEFMLACAIK